MAYESEMVILSGSAYPEQAQAAYEWLMHTPLITEQEKRQIIDGQADVGKFPDQESSGKIKSDVRNQDVFLFQATIPPANDRIQEGVLMVDALRRASVGRITFVESYFAYARSDRKEESRDPIMAKAKLKQFEGAGVDRFLTMDLHADQIQGFTDLPFDHLKTGVLICRHLAELEDIDVVVGPDFGAAKRTRKYANLLSADKGLMDKDRINPTATAVTTYVGPRLKGKTILIAEDLISTGTTAINAAEFLKKEKKAGKIILSASHAFLVKKAMKRLVDSDFIDEIYVTNSVKPSRKLHDTVHVIDIVPYLALASWRVHKGISLSEIINDPPSR